MKNAFSSVVVLKMYSSNGHNFGVESYIPSPQDAKSVTVSLPNVETETLNALRTYQTARKVTLRSSSINKWLEERYSAGQLFLARLEVKNSEHHYRDIVAIRTI